MNECDTELSKPVSVKCGRGRGRERVEVQADNYCQTMLFDFATPLHRLSQVTRQWSGVSVAA